MVVDAGLRLPQVEQTKMQRSSRAELDALSAKLKSARADAGILRKNLEEETLLAKEPRARVMALTEEKKELQNEVARLTADLAAHKGTVEHMIQANQALGMEYLAILPLKPAMSFMYDFVHAKVESVRAAEDLSKVRGHSPSPPSAAAFAYSWFPHSLPA